MDQSVPAVEESATDIVDIPGKPLDTKSHMKCCCCGSSDWKNVDEFRIIPKGMSICTTCGFVSYPSLYKTEEEIKAHYRTDYRSIPKVGNLFTGTRKNHNHDLFLGPELTKLKEAKENPVICEVGAAYGLFLHHLQKSYFPKGEFYGTELTTTYRRIAFYEHGMNLTEDFDASRKYDLIISYKVAEHQIDPHIKIRQYAECLAEGGLLYISVPTWFGQMSNFGLPGFDIEYYYDTNHINVWTRKLFETILKKAGLEIVKYDGLTYDDTYLCRRNDAVMKMEHPEFEEPDKIIEKMKGIKAAFEAMQRGDPPAALVAYPNYPEAWTQHYERKRAELHEHKQDVSFEDVLTEFYEPFKAACGDCFETWRFVADLAMRYDAYETALEYWQKCVYIRPGAGYVLGPITHCYRRLSEQAKDKKFAAALRRKSVEITRHWISSDLETRNEAINWLYFDLSKTKLPSEQ